MLFLIRLITATFLFAFLAKANIWLTPLSNIILAFGYRVFLLLSPVLVFLSGRFAISSSMLIATVGVTVFFLTDNHLMLALGALLVAIGFSTNGYLIKIKATETPKGAGYNKVAVNIGGILSGILVIISTQSKSLFFGISGFILFLITLSTMLYYSSPTPIIFKFSKNIQIKKLVAWAAIGIAIGIKFFGVFTVLPQYLLQHNKTLPDWYGAMLFLNGAIVVLFQIPIMHIFEKKSQQNINIFILTLYLMIFGMVIISLPAMFNVNHLYGAIIWTILLSLIECCSSYLDYTAAEKGYLLTKEISIGIGAGLTVLISRYFNASLSPLILGGIGTLLIVFGFYHLKEHFKR